LEAIMEVIYPRCAGLDVHKQTVVACVRIAGDGPPLQEVRTFTTTTSGLLALADWVDSFGVEQVGMEATGVYWKPVWHVLEGHFELVLANAAHVKNVPGRRLAALQILDPQFNRGICLAKGPVLGSCAQRFVLSITGSVGAVYRGDAALLRYPEPQAPKPRSGATTG